MSERFSTSEVNVSGVIIGGNSPVVVQTMCNTHTADIDESVQQCIECAKAGAQIIRLTTQGEREVAALAEIKKCLKDAGYAIPLVADIHFRGEVAIQAAKVADKVRINPGNFHKEFNKAQEIFKEFIKVCKENNTAVRIGLNHGSLGERIINMYGNTPLGMAQAAMEWLQMCAAENFHNVVVSLKASNTVVMVNAYRLLVEKMKEAGFSYPLHLGVTEAGNADMGRIKSAVGIGALLAQGIGDTIRVSLTETPANEIAAGDSLKEYFQKDSATGTSLFERHYASIEQQRNIWLEQGSKGIFTPAIEFEGANRNDLIIKASALFGPLLLDKSINDFNPLFKLAGGCSIDVKDFKDNLMQAARRKFTKPEYIACPGCGRTMYNLEQTFEKVKARTSHLAGVKIAVMGCIVNGPGEMADADFGYVGAGRGCVALYKGSERVIYSIPEDEAIDKLIELIEGNLSESTKK